MKTSHKIKFLALAPTLSLFCPCLVSLSSCSNKSVGKIDGTDWTGHLAGSFLEDDYLINEKEKTITYIFGRSIHSYNLIIPNFVVYKKQQYKVQLGKNCFKNNLSLQGSVELNDFISTIPQNCFMGCTSLTGIIFHNYPTKIDNGAFINCFLLTQMIVYKKHDVRKDWTLYLKKIGDFAFFNCQLSGDLVFGPGIQYIGESAFEKCIGITSVDMSTCDFLQNTSRAQFASCTMLKYVKLPKTLYRIEDKTFRDCPYLLTIDLPTDNMTLSIGEDAFYDCKAFTNFSKPVKFSYVGKGAFSLNFNNKVHLWEPKYGLEKIRPYTYSDCNFAKLSFHYNGPDVMDYAFANNSNLCILDFTDFINEQGHFEAPKWTGKHIFVGANNGGTIIFPAEGVISSDWKDFFTNNDIVLSSGLSGGWTITHQESRITKIVEPEEHTTYIYPSETQGDIEVSFENFSYEAEEHFDKERDKDKLILNFKPSISTSCCTASISSQEIIWDDVDQKFSVKFIISYNATKPEFWINIKGLMTFFYENIEVDSIKQEFNIDIAPKFN